MNNKSRALRSGGDGPLVTKKALSCVVAAGGFAAAVWGGPANADSVMDWNAYAGEAAVNACLSPFDNPLHESRMYAMMHLAIHDALNAIERRSSPYAFDEVVISPADPNAAIAAAARDVLVAAIEAIPSPFPFPQICIDNGLASVEEDYAQALADVADGAAKDNGLALGRTAAAAILEARDGDGSDTPLIDLSYAQGTAPGEYRFTDGFPFAFAPGWGEVEPFTLTSGEMFRPRPPNPVSCVRPSPRHAYAGSCQQYAADFDEVKALGALEGSARDADQTQVALFWIESSPLAWNRMARMLSENAALDLHGNARLFALLNAALADGYIASFDAKYHYNYWRPATAIRSAANDDNPATVENKTWSSLAPTPPMPDYPSAHAVQGGAAAEVFTQFFGTDHVYFEACSLTLPDPNGCAGPEAVWRGFTSFSAAAEENALSRVLVGYHFRLASEEGLKQGRKIGAYTVERLLTPTY